MANAFILRPLPMINSYFSGSFIAGAPQNILNDYAGVTCTRACDIDGSISFLGADLGSDQAFDTVMLFGVSDLPASATFQLNGATSATPDTVVPLATGFAYAGAAPREDGSGVLLAMLPFAVSYRYVSVVMNAGIGGQKVTVSRIVAGRRFHPAIGFEYGAQFGVRDLGALDVSRRGVLLRNRGKKLRTVSLNFPRLTKQEAESTAQKMLEQVGNTECIAVCTDPAADAERQNRCYFGPLVGDLSRTWVTAAGHEVRLNLLGVM